MKVHRLWIGGHRVLRDINIEFSPHLRPKEDPETGATSEHALDLLVGVNGSGKSTVLRSLVEVFRRIGSTGQTSDLLFSITYERTPGEVYTVENVHRDRTPLDTGFHVWKGRNGADWPGGAPDRAAVGEDRPEFRSNVSDLLPARIVTHTTGKVEAWDDVSPTLGDDLDPSSWRNDSAGPYWFREQPGSPSPAESGPEQESGSAGDSRHVQIRMEDLHLVTLCGLLEHAAQAPAHRKRHVLEQVLEEIGLKGMTAFALRFRLEPGVVQPQHRREIAALGAVASRARVQGTSLSLVFDLSRDVPALLKALQDALFVESTLGLYEKLSSHARPGRYRPLLERVDLFLEKTSPRGNRASPPELHTYDWLSDGERTFLGRMCMISLFGATDALILLDEPEVHFNDYWKRKLVRMLEGALETRHSHAIVTTHSSIVLTDARVDQVIILDRGEDGYTRVPQRPSVPTLGADPSDVLVQVFGAEQASGAKIVKEVRDVLDEYEEGHVSTLDLARLSALRHRLERLQKELAPGYWRFRVRDALLALPRSDAPQA